MIKKIIHQEFFGKDFLLCFLSAGMIVLSFPGAELWLLAWAGLVPFLHALENKGPGKCFILGYWTGVLIFAGTLYWLVHVTLFGLIILVMYLALYPGIFAVMVRVSSRLPAMLKLFLLPSFWVALEFIRGKLFTGFGWVSLGLSQYKNLVMIQIADITGVAGVSFLIVLANYVIKEWTAVPLGSSSIPSIIAWNPTGPGKKQFQEITKISGAAAGVLILTIGYGLFRMQVPQPLSGGMKIAVVQANVPQELKWMPPIWPTIMQKYLRITREAALQKPDLIIWPETSFPGYLWEAEDLFAEVRDFTAQVKIPLLIGAVNQSGGDYYNSAILLSRDGSPAQKYDKLHLVPFGEFIPFRNAFPLLSEVIGIGDFTRGKEWTVLETPPSGRDRLKFAVLICFEDTFAYLARGFSSRGIDFLVNMTNDAWFLDTSEPFMHLQSSVFRAVENRKYLVRAANTGVSGFINDRGQIYNQVQQNGKATYVEGFTVDTIYPQSGETLYTKLGDVFTYFCFGCILWGIMRIKTGRIRNV